MQTPNTGGSLFSLACQISGIDRNDMVEHVVDHVVSLLLAPFATKEMHGVKYDAQEALGWDIMGLFWFKPSAINTSSLYEGCSEPLDAFHSEEDACHQLSF